MAYNDEDNEPHYLPPDDGLQRQTDGKGVAFAVAFARIPTHEADNRAAGLAQPVAFPWLIFQLPTETTLYCETVLHPCSLSPLETCQRRDSITDLHQPFYESQKGTHKLRPLHGRP